jgi:hypothetical protein
MKQLDRREFLSATAALGKLCHYRFRTGKNGGANRYEKF